VKNKERVGEAVNAGKLAGEGYRSKNNERSGEIVVRS
jgi:hypothetical protein